jgi:hypothetical protein
MQSSLTIRLSRLKWTRIKERERERERRFKFILLNRVTIEEHCQTLSMQSGSSRKVTVYVLI